MVNRCILQSPRITYHFPEIIITIIDSIHKCSHPNSITGKYASISVSNDEDLINISAKIQLQKEYIKSQISKTKNSETKFLEILFFKI